MMALGPIFHMARNTSLHKSLTRVGSNRAMCNWFETAEEIKETTEHRMFFC